MALKCELCGGTNLVKQEGFFVCQHCGAKYTVEEAKKLFSDHQPQQQNVSPQPAASVTGGVEKENKTDPFTIEVAGLKDLLAKVKIGPTDLRIREIGERTERINDIIESFDIESAEKNKLRESLCYLVRETAVALHNEKHETARAISIEENLLTIFKDLPNIKQKLNEDLIALNGQSINNSRKAPPSVPTAAVAGNQTKGASASQKSSPANNTTQDNSRKSGKGLMFLLLILLVAGFIYISQINKTTPTRNDYSATTVTVTATPTTKPTATPVPVIVKNGEILISPDYEQVCPFTVEGSSTSDYYIYLKYQKAPVSSKEKRTQKSGARVPYEEDIAVYLKAGAKVNIDVPIGVYKLYYSTGQVFYGTEKLFGEGSRYYSSDDLLSFYADGEYYQGHTLTLYTVANGNYDTDPIDESQFPKR